MSAIQYQQVTDRIVAMLEAGVTPWRKPWVAGAGPSINGMVRPRRIGGLPYRGVNTVNLWAAGQVCGYASPYWMTFKAARDFGASVRKGERAELAFFVGQTTRVIENDAGEEEEDTFSFLKAYPVFNAEQIDGLPDRYLAAVPMVPVDDASNRHAEAEAFIRATGATVRHGGDKAFYSPSDDYVQMPAFEAFTAPEAYYGTMLHELTHWTAPASRCDRQLGRRFGDDAYAAEELVAELGAAFLSGDLRVSAEPRADHASYIATWLKVLKADNRAIFRAAALAEKAAGYLLALYDDAAPQPAPVSEPVSEPAEPVAPIGPKARRRKRLDGVAAPAEPEPEPVAAPAEPEPEPEPTGPKPRGRRKRSEPAPAEPVAPVSEPVSEPVAPVAPEPEPVAGEGASVAPSPSERFWTTLQGARAAYAAEHGAAPLPWVATPRGARKLSFVNRHGERVSVKQPAQFACPPARYWPDGRLPVGVVAAPALCDQTAADRLAAAERRHAANVANLERWVAAYSPGNFALSASDAPRLRVARAILANAPGLSTDRLGTAVRLRAACVVSAARAELARRATVREAA